MSDKTARLPRESAIDDVMRPLIEQLGGTRPRRSASRGCGTTWTIDPACGGGALWYLPINGVAAVASLALTASRPLSLSTGASGFACFGQYAREARTSMAGGASAPGARPRRALLGYSWKNPAFRGTLDEGETLRSTSIYLLPEAITAIASAAHARPAELETAIALLDGTRRLPRLERLFDELDAVRLSPGCAEAFLRCKAVEACLYLIDWLDQAGASEFPHMTAEDMTALNVARSWAESHLREPICLDDLCRAACVSPTKLAALFRAHGGATPMGWVRNRRMERACELLASTDAALGSIAAEVGFAKHASFSSAFKAKYGVTPNQYRALHRGGDGAARLADVLPAR